VKPLAALLHLIVASFFRARLDPSRDVSRLAFRVWPHDLDILISEPQTHT